MYIQINERATMTNKILKPIFISFIQFILSVITYKAIVRLYPIPHKSVGFGLTIFFTGIFFNLTILLFNFYLAFFKKNIYWVALILFFLVAVFPFEAFNEKPLRSLLLILIAFFGFLSSLILNKILTKKEQ